MLLFVVANWLHTPMACQGHDALILRGHFHLTFSTPYTHHISLLCHIPSTLLLVFGQDLLRIVTRLCQSENETLLGLLGILYFLNIRLAATGPPCFS